MPYKCCVPGCKSNYGGTTDYVSVFKFPSDSSRLDLWIRKIPRENLVVNKHARICIRHFEEQFVMRNFVFRGKDGLMHTEPRDTPILTDDAYPSLFPDLPKYMSEKVPKKRKNPDVRRDEIDDRSDAVLEEFLQADRISDYNNFEQQLHSHVKDFIGHWSMASGINGTVIYVLDMNSEVPCLSVCIKVQGDMAVKVFVGSVQLSARQLSWVLGDNCVLERWSQLETMLGHYKDYHPDDGQNLIEVRRNVDQACALLTDVCDSAGDDRDDLNIPCILFC